MSPIGPAANTDTRDIAVIANTKVDQHIQECINLRVQIMENFQHLRNDIKDLSKNSARINWIVALIIGGLILATRVPDLLNFIKSTGTG